MILSCQFVVFRVLLYPWHWPSSQQWKRPCRKPTSRERGNSALEFSRAKAVRQQIHLLAPRLNPVKAHFKYQLEEPVAPGKVTQNNLFKNAQNAHQGRNGYTRCGMYIYKMKYYAVPRRKDILTYNMDESWGYYGKWNKPVTKGQILYGSTNVNEVLRVIKSIETESRTEVTST